MTQALHGAGIFIYIDPCSTTPIVGQYASPMECVGDDLLVLEAPGGMSEA